MSLHTLRQDWFSNVRNDLLAGLVVALALIPEAIAFSIIAGVDPKVGLYASFCVFHPNSATHNDRNPPPVTTPSRPPIPPAKPPPIPIKKPARS
ncbi:MAG: SulP family inorganic anion transporter, partial [Sphingobium sp.]|nr:SulP family inorganic anion transporter [Sphingobium sp.]